MPGKWIALRRNKSSQMLYKRKHLARESQNLFTSDFGQRRAYKRMLSGKERGLGALLVLYLYTVLNLHD